MRPVRPLPALQCTTHTFSGWAASQAVASMQKSCAIASGGTWATETGVQVGGR